MFSLVLAIILGGLFAYIALQNAALVPFSLGTATFTLPLYLVAFGALLFGILLSAVFSLGGWASSAVALSSKNNQLSKAQQIINDLTSRLRSLELENTELKGETRGVKQTAVAHQELAHQQAHQQDRPHDHLPGPSLLDRLRYKLAI